MGKQACGTTTIAADLAHLGQKDDCRGLVQCCAIHVDCGSQGHHKVHNAALAPHLLCTLHGNLHSMANAGLLTYKRLC